MPTGPSGRGSGYNVCGSSAPRDSYWWEGAETTKARRMAREKRNRNSDEARHVIRVAALVLGVLATVAFGASLQVETVAGGGAEVWTEIDADTGQAVAGQNDALTPADPRDTAPTTIDDANRPEPRAREPESRAASPAPSRPAPSSAAPSSAARFATRVADSTQLQQDGDGWTLQFLLTCSEEKARSFLDGVDGDPRLYVLPSTYDGNACYRICWGSYSTRERAVGDGDLPGVLVAAEPNPIPRKLADLAP